MYTLSNCTINVNKIRIKQFLYEIISWIKSPWLQENLKRNDSLPVPATSASVSEFCYCHHEGQFTNYMARNHQNIKE